MNICIPTGDRNKHINRCTNLWSMFVLIGLILGVLGAALMAQSTRTITTRQFHIVKSQIAMLNRIGSGAQAWCEDKCANHHAEDADDCNHDTDHDGDETTYNCDHDNESDCWDEEHCSWEHMTADKVMTFLEEMPQELKDQVGQSMPGGEIKPELIQQVFAEGYGCNLDFATMGGDVDMSTWEPCPGVDGMPEMHYDPTWERNWEGQQEAVDNTCEECDGWMGQCSVGTADMTLLSEADCCGTDGTDCWLTDGTAGTASWGDDGTGDCAAWVPCHYDRHDMSEPSDYNPTFRRRLFGGNVTAEGETEATGLPRMEDLEKFDKYQKAGLLGLMIVGMVGPILTTIGMIFFCCQLKALADDHETACESCCGAVMGCVVFPIVFVVGFILSILSAVFMTFMCTFLTAPFLLTDLMMQLRVVAGDAYDAKDPAALTPMFRQIMPLMQKSVMSLADGSLCEDSYLMREVLTEPDGKNVCTGWLMSYRFGMAAQIIAAVFSLFGVLITVYVGYKACCRNNRDKKTDVEMA